MPQGDVLSPTLYIIMCNDYPDPENSGASVRNFCKQYADDFTQVIINRFRNTITDAQREMHKDNVQAEIDKQNDYERKWKMKTNINKFVLIAVCFTKTPEIRIDGVVKSYDKKGKILGLSITDNNFFRLHIDGIVKKAKQVQGIQYRF